MFKSQMGGLALNRQKWSEMGPEWSPGPENRPPGMPRPFPSLWDPSRGQKSATKVKKLPPVWGLALAKISVLKLNIGSGMLRLSAESAHASSAIGKKDVSKFPKQCLLALRGSDGFSRDLWRVPGVNARSLGARSCCKNRYLVTLTFAPLSNGMGGRELKHLKTQ